GADCRMSLKARLEAVIYAAEEPVTLAQLASLFAAEAFEWKAQQEAARIAAAQEENPQPLLGEAVESAGMDPLGLEQSPAIYSGSEPEPAAAVEEATAPPPEAAESAPEAGTLDAETEARRQARLRDREVRGILRQILNELITSYASDDRGIEMREIAGGYRMATKPECHDAVRLFIKSQKPPLKLSLPALETLAVIAYKQPVTAPEVNEIRGVESGGVLGSLLSRKLIATAGRKQVIGRPILYKTTKEFLLRFGLKDISELPSMEEFEKMAAIELAEPTAEEVAEESVGAPPEGQPDLDEDAPEDESAETAEVPAEPQAAGEVPAETETAHHEG
ncbi:MAG TPA: SMC-Scp complex subunit ScpB, partial [Terracidiphilus sp.]|nr:SMC-Scp complex subunit ScpB [Terracidiphilus sp.]